MYKRTTQGWLKHLDFILWDILALQASFVLGYMIRRGWGQWPYQSSNYKSLAIILVVVDILVTVLFNTMHNVMKRGYMKEMIETIKHVVLVLLAMSLYLFSTQSGDAYSRITIYLTSGFHLVLGYLVRILWKPLIRKINKNKSKGTMILVADENAIHRILDKASDLDDFAYAGIVLSNRDGTGETIRNIKVVSGIENAADYICREWVDEVFVYPEHLSDLKTTSYESIEEYIDNSYGTQTAEKAEKKAAEQSAVARLIEQCREMAIPIHIRLPISSSGGKSFMEKVGGYNVLTMTANYASPLQMIVKRLFDIIGGIIGSFFALVLIAMIGPKIKKESPGPVLFKQTRIGQNGKRFIVYKISDTEKNLKHALSGNNTGQTGTIQPFKQLCFC